MALRDGNVSRFFLSTADQALIDETTITCVESSSTDRPQSLRMTFMLKDRAAPAGPQLRPLAPGRLTFIADPTLARVLPDAGKLTAARYDPLRWPVVGSVLLDIDAQALARLAALAGFPTRTPPGARVPKAFFPERIWYSRVVLTKAFLFQTLSPRLPRPKDGNAGPGSAIHDFLSGKAQLSIKAGTMADRDDAVVLDMPRVIAERGQVALVVCAASAPKPRDGSRNDIAGHSKLTLNAPSDPANGSFPARLVYTALRKTAAGDMSDGATGLPVVDRALAGAAYLAIRVTRVWRPEADCSVHFPSQSLLVQRTGAAPGTQPLQLRLPCHGLAFLAVPSASATGQGDRYLVSFRTESPQPEREMWWLDATVDPSAWRTPAKKAPIPLTLVPWQAGASIPHVILRRRMGQEVIYDRNGVRPQPFGCTYASIRRCLRALVNNRIAGGRLNYENYFAEGGWQAIGVSRADTEQLVRGAMPSAAYVVLDGAPDIFEIDEKKARRQFEALFQAFWPDLMPLVANLGDPAKTTRLPRGEAAYLTWQSIVEDMQAAATRANFASELLGGGGAGALIAAGLATGYASIRDEQTPREDRATYAEAVVADLLSGRVEPGAVLQFWWSMDDFFALRKRNFTRRNRDGILDADGHSPVFLSYANDGAGKPSIAILDQYGAERLRVVTKDKKRRLRWGRREPPDVWIAANWNE